MVDRLVLGSDSLVHTVVESLQDRSGTVSIGTDDEHLAVSLREEGVAVESLDTRNPDALGVFDADMVFVLEETRDGNLATARAAREAFPDAYLLAYTGEDTTSDSVRLGAVADRVVDPWQETASHILNRIEGADGGMRQLRRILHGIDRLAVVTHDNPDPDAIASGVALARLARAAGCEAEVCYYGTITHQENRAFVNVLDLELRNLDPGEDLSEFDGLALVDHSRPGVNDQLPEDTEVDIVIDHHPPRAPVNARYVDLRSGVGATSTLLVDYLDQFGVEIDEVVATALLFGIHVDTKEFSREVSARDFEAAATLVPVADLGVLERIESPSVTASTLGTIASAIRNRRIEGEVLLSSVGRLSERDALSQAADRLLTLEGVTTSLVYGVMDGTIFISARSRGTDIDLGETLREAFDKIGSAGGHVDMAGAQITLGVLEAVDDNEESLQQVIEQIVADRFLDAVEANMTRPITGVYAPTYEGEEGYFVPERYPDEGPEERSNRRPDERSNGDRGDASQAESGTDTLAEDSPERSPGETSTDGGQ